MTISFFSSPVSPAAERTPNPRKRSPKMPSMLRLPRSLKSNPTPGHRPQRLRRLPRSGRTSRASGVAQHLVGGVDLFELLLEPAHPLGFCRDDNAGPNAEKPPSPRREMPRARPRERHTGPAHARVSIRFTSPSGTRSLRVDALQQTAARVRGCSPASSGPGRRYWHTLEASTCATRAPHARPNGTAQRKR